MVLVLGLAILLHPPAALGAGQEVCHTSGPAGGEYHVRVCIVDPPAGSRVQGATTVRATVTVEGRDPGVRRVLFYLDGGYILTDYVAPHEFLLPSHKFVDGVRQLEAEAFMQDGFITQRVGVALTLDNGVREPPVNRRAFTPSPGAPVQPGRPFVVAAAGDGASDLPSVIQVTDLIASWEPNLFLYLGDVYERGTPTEFFNWYGTPEQRYGRFRSITNPAIGNHEYDATPGGGYFDYWDNAPNYYSFDAAGWHFISLNSTDQFNQRDPGTPQYEWLVADLAAHAGTRCTIAYFHHPRYSIGHQGDWTATQPIWQALYDAGVDLILNGHEHNYQRWHPLDGQGHRVADGLTQIIVGTGGHGIQGFIRNDDRMAVGYATNPEAYGALRLELYPDRAVFQFVNITGQVLDAGEVPCRRGDIPDNAPPSVPVNLRAVPGSRSHIDLSWSAATDDVGVAGYTIYRNGIAVTNVEADILYFADMELAPGVTYRYQVEAFDDDGKRSGPSAPVEATTSTASIFAVLPVADAYVNETNPDQNYGSSARLRTDGNPILNSYLRFDLAPLRGRGVRARLRVFARTDSEIGYQVYGLENHPWSEHTITYTNAPAPATLLGGSGAFDHQQWTEVDVTPWLAGRSNLNLVMTTMSQTAISYRSREAGYNGPHLIVEMKAGPRIYLPMVKK